MEIPAGFLAKLWSFMTFLPFFFLLFLLGVLKGQRQYFRLSDFLLPTSLALHHTYVAVIISPVAVVIILVGNSSVILGLWPAHFIWTFYCVAKTKRLGLVLKILLLLVLPVPLLLWPLLGITGSLLVGIGYGFLTPLIATFEAVGEHEADKCLHCFIDGCWSTVLGSCTAVRDFTDFCFHSYFSYMDELSERIVDDETRMDIKLSLLPSCFLVSLLAVLVDVPMITAVALWKCPYMLLKGWKRLLEDWIGREGPFLETVCVPFAGLAIILWPLAVIGAVVSAFLFSFFLACYGGVVVHQENSPPMGLAYIISIISIFDEYTNDLLYLREGSCFPRPVYSKRKDPRSELLDRKRPVETDNAEDKNGTIDPYSSKLISQRSRTLKNAIQQLKPVQMWDWLFRSCEMNGRMLLHDGLIDASDIEECMLKGKCKKMIIKLPAYCVLQFLLRSARSNSPGLLITDEIELTKFNWPKDKVFEWLLGPLLIMKEQIKQLRLNESEEDCLCKLIMSSSNNKPEDWNVSEFPSDDGIRRAQLQAILRRLQGIVSSLSRMPSFRRRFRDLVKVLYLEAIQNGVLSQDGGSSRQSGKAGGSVGYRNKLNGEGISRHVGHGKGPDEELERTNRTDQPHNGDDLV